MKTYTQSTPVRELNIDNLSNIDKKPIDVIAGTPHSLGFTPDTKNIIDFLIENGASKPALDYALFTTLAMPSDTRDVTSSHPYMRIPILSHEDDIDEEKG